MLAIFTSVNMKAENHQVKKHNDSELGFFYKSLENVIIEKSGNVRLGL